MPETKYNDAVYYFNQAGNSSADDIRYTYDSEKNILIRHHEDAERKSSSAGENAFWGVVSTAFAANSTYKAVDSGDWSADGPSWSIFFMAVFGISYLSARAARNRIVKAVDRNVQADQQNKSGPVL